MSQDAKTAYLEQLTAHEHEPEPDRSAAPSAEAQTVPRLRAASSHRVYAPSRETSFGDAYGPLLYFTLLALIPVASLTLLLLAPPGATTEEPTPEEWAALMNAAPPAAERTTLPSPAALRVESDPEGSLVYIDGELSGITPYRADTLNSGWRVVSVGKTGYATQDTLLYVDPKAATTLSLTLDRLDAEATSTTTLEPAPPPLAPAPPSQTAPSLGLPPPTPDREPAFSAPISRMGTLSVLVRPWGSIYVDDTLRARNTDLRWTDTVPAGSRVVRVVHPVLGVQQHRVEVEPDQTTSLAIDLY